MKRAEVVRLIPIALAELRDDGRSPAYFDEISRQVTLHDEAYVKRRAALRRGLGRVGITISEQPSGFLRPGPAKMYPALAKLEGQGVIVGDFEELPREDNKPRRRMYRLADTNVLPVDAARNFRYDMLHRDDADPTLISGSRELTESELEGIVAGGDPLATHDDLRRRFGIDFPGTELDPNFEPPEHPLGY